MLDSIKALISRKSHAFQRQLSGPLGEIVVKDLAEFCRADRSTFHPDPRVHAMLEGRREVWLRINKHLSLTPEQILQLRMSELTPEKDPNA